MHTPSSATSDTDVFDDVFSLQALDDLVAHGARLPAVRMVADGAALAPSRFCSPTRLGGRNLDDVVDPAKVVARLADGATLVMQSLHRTSSSVGAFVARLQDELSHPVQANAYLTPPNAVGLAEHSDLHDVLAVQLHGSKRWWVDGLGDVAMRPGDVMYVPRGVRHRAETATETSLHLTLGVIRVTARQVIDRILNAGPELLDDPLPIGYRHRSRGDELERHLDAALDAALDLIGAADLGAVACDEQSRRLARPPSAGRIASNVLLDRLDAGAVIHWIAPEPLARAIDETDGRLGDWDRLRKHDDRSPRPAQITIHLGDRTLTVPTAALDALRTLSDGRPTRVGDLPGLDES
ncbi:MAG TPA: cupin domain-containing protein, partial [Ilumatobacteraceae bacterium]|nr:cupin domain-containing protein [Ilumatobacteraceae bacterium]